MKTIQSLILGSAAALLAVGGAQAADLPVKAKAVEYVRICSLYGAGFYYIPGTDTCLKLGGYLRVDTTFNPGSAQGVPAYSGDAGIGDRYHNYFVARSREAITIDTRTATEYGVVRTFGQLDLTQSTLGSGAFSPATTTNSLSATPVLDTAGSGSVFPEQAFVQFAGFTFGKSWSAFTTPWNGYPGNISDALFGSPNDITGVNNIQYTAQFGNGVSATIGLDDPSAYGRTAVYNLATGGALAAGVVAYSGTAANAYAGAHMPDIVGNVKIDQAWGLFQLSGKIHEVDASYNNLTLGTANVLSDLSGHPDSKYGGAVLAALQIKNLPTGPGDDIKISGVWSKGDTKDVISTSGASPSFLMFGSGPTGTLGSLAFGPTTDGVFLPGSAGGDGSIHLTTAYGFNGAFNHNWNPHWASALFGSYSQIRYDATAQANYCAAYALTVANAAGTYTCNPNYSVSQIGVNTKWTPVANLTFTAEAIYMRLGTGFSGTATTIAATAPLPTGTYQFKSQNTVELQLRAQRNF